MQITIFGTSKSPGVDSEVCGDVFLACKEDSAWAMPQQGLDDVCYWIKYNSLVISIRHSVEYTQEELMISSHGSDWVSWVKLKYLSDI